MTSLCQNLFLAQNLCGSKLINNLAILCELSLRPHQKHMTDICWTSHGLSTNMFSYSLMHYTNTHTSTGCVLLKAISLLHFWRIHPQGNPVKERHTAGE